MSSPLVPFTPAPVQPRHDGWTPEKQIAFIEALAVSACVEDACKAVGMRKASAYRLRLRPSARAFREAWDAAVDCGMQQLEQAMLARAINGVARPVFYKGEQIGEWRHHDERLAMFLLRYRRADRYGGWLDRVAAPEEPDSHYQAEGRLDWHLDEIELAESNPWIEAGAEQDKSSAVDTAPPAPRARE